MNIDLKNISKEDLIKALRKVEGVNCYVIEDKYIVEIPIKEKGVVLCHTN